MTAVGPMIVGDYEGDPPEIHIEPTSPYDMNFDEVTLPADDQEQDKTVPEPDNSSLSFRDPTVAIPPLDDDLPALPTSSTYIKPDRNDGKLWKRLKYLTRASGLYLPTLNEVTPISLK